MRKKLIACLTMLLIYICTYAEKGCLMSSYLTGELRIRFEMKWIDIDDTEFNQYSRECKNNGTCYCCEIRSSSIHYLLKPDVPTEKPDENSKEWKAYQTYHNINKEDNPVVIMYKLKHLE